MKTNSYQEIMMSLCSRSFNKQRMKTSPQVEERTVKHYNTEEEDEKFFKRYAVRPSNNEENDVKDCSSEEEGANMTQWKIDRTSKMEAAKDYSSEEDEDVDLTRMDDADLMGMDDAELTTLDDDRPSTSHKRRKRKHCNDHLDPIEIDILRNCQTELSKHVRCSCLQAMEPDDEQCDADYRAAMQAQPSNDGGRSSVRLVDLAILFGVYMIRVYLTDFLLMLVIILLIGLFLMRYWEARQEASFRCVHECPVHAIFPSRPPLDCHPGCSVSHNPPCHAHGNHSNVCEHHYR